MAVSMAWSLISELVGMAAGGIGSECSYGKSTVGCHATNALPSLVVTTFWTWLWWPMAVNVGVFVDFVRIDWRSVFGNRISRVVAIVLFCLKFRGSDLLGMEKWISVMFDCGVTDVNSWKHARSKIHLWITSDRWRGCKKKLTIEWKTTLNNVWMGNYEEQCLNATENRKTAPKNQWNCLKIFENSVKMERFWWIFLKMIKKHEFNDFTY